MRGREWELLLLRLVLTCAQCARLLHMCGLSSVADGGVEV